MRKCNGCGSVVGGSVCPACGTNLDEMPPPPGPGTPAQKATPPPLPPAFVSPSQMPAAPPSYPPPDVVRCPTGHVSAPGAKFCGQCGFALVGAADLPPMPPSPPAFGAGPSPESSEQPPSKSQPRKWPVLVAGVGLLAVLVAAGAWSVLLRPSNDEKYIEALEEAGVRSEFQTDRAAVLRAESLCEEFEASGEPKGGAIENAAAEFYCPQWLDGFQVLETTTISGTFDVIDSDYYSYADGAFCEGDGGYGDINGTTQVVVTSGSGDNLTRTELGSGSVDGGRCSYAFSFEVTEGEEIYVVAVGDRGESTYTFDELKEGLALSLG